MYTIISIYLSIYRYISLSIYLSISLSLSIYIYIYIYMKLYSFEIPGPASLKYYYEAIIRKGTHWVSTNGVTANFTLLTEGLFGYSH